MIFLRYIYIKKLEKKEEIFWLNSLPNWLKNCIWNIIERMNIILKKQIDENRVIWFIPNIEKQNSDKKLRNKLEKEKQQAQKLQMILSKEIKPYQTYFRGYPIIDGRITFFCAIESMLEKIMQKQPMAMQDIYVLTNHYQGQHISLIKKLTPNVKSMNIITKEIERYRIVEELMQEQGMAISVSNNKRKSLKKAKLIINLDFSKEELKEYTIYRNALLITIPQEKITNLKGFEGIIIQDVAIEWKEQQIEWIRQNQLEHSFRQLEMWESLKEGNLQKETIQVTKLYGNNGQINEKELQNWRKNIDKLEKLD